MPLGGHVTGGANIFSQAPPEGGASYAHLGRAQGGGTELVFGSLRLHCDLALGGFGRRAFLKPGRYLGNDCL